MNTTSGKITVGYLMKNYPISTDLFLIRIGLKFKKQEKDIYHKLVTDDIILNYLQSFVDTFFQNDFKKKSKINILKGCLESESGILKVFSTMEDKFSQESHKYYKEVRNYYYLNSYKVEIDNKFKIEIIL